MKKLLLTAALAWSVCATVVGAEETKLSPLTVAGATVVDAMRAKQLFDRKVVFIDTRNDKDWDSGRIPGAIHIDVRKAFDEATLSKAVPKDQGVVMYCNGEKCLRSSEASVLAVQWGFKKVYYFRDGFPAWQGAGLPVE